MFCALDNVNYETVILNEIDVPKDDIRQPPSLVSFSCQAINGQTKLAVTAARTIPRHLAPTLLRVAIENDQCCGIVSILANWPLPTLRFKELLSKEFLNVFKDRTDFDLNVFEGVYKRTKFCKMETLDLRGMPLNSRFKYIVVRMWPFLSLKRYQLRTKQLAKFINDSTGTDNDVAAKILPHILSIHKALHEVTRPQQIINIPKGKSLTIRLDEVTFSSTNTFFFDYFIANCVREMAPLKVIVSNVRIHVGTENGVDAIDSSERLHLDIENGVDSIAPFIVFKGHDPETLEGISLRHLEENVFFLVASDLKKFRNLRALDIQDCNIYLQHGRTRSRTSGRLKLVNMLEHYDHLSRLNLSSNYLLGCIGELLDALSSPLEYLNLSGCDLNESDLIALSTSHHAKHLKELNLAKLCQFSIYAWDQISPSILFSAIDQFPNLVILNLSHNGITDAPLPELCATLQKSLPHLKGLDMGGNILSMVSLKQLVRTCANMKHMQKLRITHYISLAQEIFEPVQIQEQMAQMRTSINGLLKSLNRPLLLVQLDRVNGMFMEL